MSGCVRSSYSNYLIISDLGGCLSPRSRGRVRCEDCPSIDIRHPVARKLANRSGGTISWIWTRSGSRYCVTELTFQGRSAVASTSIDHSEPQRCRIPLELTTCHYGGVRRWFLCPGCGRRCAKLHFHVSLFRCRRCHGLSYMSQLTAQFDRPRLAAQKIRRSLGGSSDLTARFPAKPAGMHWRTYQSIRRRCARYENAALLRLNDWMERQARH